MKKIILAYLFLLCSVSLSAQTANSTDSIFFKGSLVEAKAKAKSENKRLMIMASATFCGPCKDLERNVYPTPEFRKLRDDNNLLLIYYHDLDKNDPDNIRTIYKIAAYPSFIVLDPDGNETVRIAGNARSKEVFCKKMNSVLQPQNAHDARKQRLEEDPSTAYEYIMFLHEAFFYSEMEQTMYELLKKGPLENYFTDQWWYFYNNYATFIDSGIINYMLDYPQQVVAVIGQEKYDQFLAERGYKMIDVRVSGSNKKYKQVRQILEYIDLHPQLETPLSQFFKKNIDMFENGDGLDFFNETMTWIKDADTKFRSSLVELSVSKLTSLERKELEQYMIKAMEEAYKYETDDKAKNNYSTMINTMKNRA